MRQRAAYESDDSVLCWQKCIASGSKPNSMMLSGYRQVRSSSRTSFEPVCEKLWTSFEPDSVMEFGFYCSVSFARNAPETDEATFHYAS